MKKTVLCVTLLTMFIVFKNATAEEIANGVVGSAKWTLSDDGVLNVSTTNGTIPTIWDGHYWDDYKDQITSIVIADGTKTIGGAFKDLSNVTSISIPSSVETIGGGAFNGLSSLKTVTIPDSVTSIGDFAFYNTTSLEQANFGNSVQSIGQSAFTGASSLKNIELPDSVVTLGNNVFGGTTSLETLKLSESLTEIPYALAWSGSNSLKELVIPDSVTAVAWRSFNGSPLERVVLGDNVENVAWQRWLTEPFYLSAGAVIYCQNTKAHNCSDIRGVGSVTVQEYTKDKSGAYVVGDDYYATAEDLAGLRKCEGGLTDECVDKALTKKANQLAQKKLCQQDVCKELVMLDYYGQTLKVGSKLYASLADWMNGKYIPKRIYTVEEAAAVVKPTGNTFKIRYR